jgi:PEGA domain-containing protein
VRIRKFWLCAAYAASLCGCAESVAIKSYPPGAKAYIDGQFVGTTPAATQIPRGNVTAEHNWRVEFRNCDGAEGKLAVRVAPGRIVGYIFTLGILAAFRGPYYFPVVDTALNGGDCETVLRPAMAPAPGITVNQIVGDRNQAGGSGQEATKTQKLAERLTTLRDLYNRKLISQDLYERESQRAVRDLGD